MEALGGYPSRVEQTSVAQSDPLGNVYAHPREMS